MFLKGYLRLESQKKTNLPPPCNSGFQRLQGSVLLFYSALKSRTRLNTNSLSLIPSELKFLKHLITRQKPTLLFRLGTIRGNLKQTGRSNGWLELYFTVTSHAQKKVHSKLQIRLLNRTEVLK